MHECAGFCVFVSKKCGVLSICTCTCDEDSPAPSHKPVVLAPVLMAHGKRRTEVSLLHVVVGSAVRPFLGKLDCRRTARDGDEDGECQPGLCVSPSWPCNGRCQTVAESFKYSFLNDDVVNI